MPKKWNSWTAGEKKTQDQTSSGCQENLQRGLGVHEKSCSSWCCQRLLEGHQGVFSSIPHQNAVQGDKPAIHHEDGAKDTNHLLLGEFNLSPITSTEAALRNQCSVWRAEYGNKCKCSHWVNIRQWLVWVHKPAGNYGRNVSFWAHPCT